MSLPKHSPPRTPSTPPRAPSAFSVYLSTVPSGLQDWFAHPRTLGMAPKTLAQVYTSCACMTSAIQLVRRLITPDLGFSVDIILSILVIVVSSVGFWALRRRRPLALTPFLVTVILLIFVTIIIWFADHVPNSAFKCDELLSLAAIIYIFLHVIRTVLCARKLMIEDIKNEIYGRF